MENLDFNLTMLTLISKNQNLYKTIAIYVNKNPKIKYQLNKYKKILNSMIITIFNSLI